MVDTFFLRLEFAGKEGGWSVNLPFLCTRCGVCCTLDDFLTAGEINATTKEHPQVHAKLKTLFNELGKMWEADEAKYDSYTMHTPCPFLVDNSCSIYEIRPGGCRLYPKTAFGMQTKDCPALTRFKKQRLALKGGRTCKESYHFVGTADSNKNEEAVEAAVLTEKQFQACVAKLQSAGATDEELKLFNDLNKTR